MDRHRERFNPLQQVQAGTLTLEGEILSVELPGGAFSVDAREAQLTFPRLMTGTGFEMTVGSVKANVWFYDPYAGRSALLSGSDQDEANIESAKGWFTGRKTAKPWLKALRAVAH